MGRLCVISMDHNLSSVDERCDLASRISSLETGFSGGEGVDEYLKLETCNRVELYLVLPYGGGSGLLDDLPSGATVFYDYEAVRHLLRVLLGLESMAKGEFHIVSQIKAAYAASSGCGKVLHRLFQRALGLAGSLRGRHPGREPSLSRIAAAHYMKDAEPGRPVMVAGMGTIGRETAHVLLLAGCAVMVSNRTPRSLDEKLSRAEVVPWELWQERAKECGAVFLCTSSPVPILGGRRQDDMPHVRVFDLGAPHQSEPRRAGARVTLDGMREIADDILGDYGVSLAALEIEADRASSALLAEIAVLTDETWKHLALSRARAIIKERAAQYARKCGASEDELEAFASSVMKAFLHPLVSARAGHGARAWRILSEEGEGRLED